MLQAHSSNPYRSTCRTNLARQPPNLANVKPSLVNLGHFGPNFDQSWPTLVHAWPSLTKLGQLLAHLAAAASPFLKP